VNVRMTTDPQQFPVSMRFLHWLMAAMVLTMLGMVLLWSRRSRTTIG
jgi:cytochrome b561